MLSDTDICNMALSHIGVGKEIASLTENSNEARACNRFFNTVKEAVLRDWGWPFSTKTVYLDLVSTNPTSEWLYAYRYPVDCLDARRIPSGVRNDTRQSRIPYRIGQDSSGKLIYCGLANAQLEYTAVTSSALYPPDYGLAFSYRLGIYIAPRLTAGDPFKIKADLMKLYTIELSTARANAANEEQEEELPDSEFINVRD